MTTIRTSENSPLYINEMPCGGGTIGMTICPGKKGSSFYGAPWRRDLTIDLPVVLEWGPAAVVSILEPHELELLEVSELGEAIQAAGVAWHLLQIRDGDVPDKRFEAAWPSLSEELHGRLGAGERILLHCRGGRGRTGVVACVLAVECGAEPAEALRRARAARPRAVETSEQERYVLALRESTT